MAAHRVSETYRQSKGTAASALQGSKVKSVNVIAGGPNVASAAESTGEQTQTLLQQFDLTAKYGPCTNMTRKQRWERASNLGLDPPSDVLRVLEQMEANHPEQQGIWAERT